MGAKGDTTAHAIQAAALRLFAAKGYAAIAMRQIADAVGIRPGAIYNHFATKQDILLALMVRHLTALAEAWDAEAPPASPEGRLDTFVRFHLHYHFSRPDEVFLSYMELRSLEPGNLETVASLRRAYEGTLREILADGMEAGRFVIADPAVQARALIAMLNGVTTWFRMDGPLSAEEVRGFYLDIARRSVGLSAAAGRENEPCSRAG